MKTSYCPNCGTQITFMRTRRDRQIPVDADTVKPSHARYIYGVHRPHFGTCRKIQAEREARRQQLATAPEEQC